MNEDNKDVKHDNGKHHHGAPKCKSYSIIVSGREKVVTSHKLSYLEVVQLFLDGAPLEPNTVYTVTYRRGPNSNHEGSMVDGDVVTIKDGMIFNVTATTKS